MELTRKQKQKTALNGLGVAVVVRLLFGEQRRQHGEHANGDPAMSTRPNNGLLKSLALLLPLLMPLSASAEYEEVIYYHNDALGSPVLATDANGDVLWQEDYTPYGSRLRYESRELSGPLAEPKDDQWDETTWFTGKQEETRLGILNFGARWYEPELGRFLAMDPVGVSPDNIFSFNRYAYANNNPYAYYDPDGRYPEHVLERNIHRTAGIVAGSALDRQLRAASANGQGAGGAVAVGVGAVVYLGPAFVAKELGQAAFEEATGVDLSWVPSAKNLGKNITKETTKNLSKVKKEVREEAIGDGKFTKKTKVIPGKGPGQSRSEMEFVKNSDGKLVRSRKFSFDRGNKFQHKKPARGGPEGRPANEN